jgi:hypothetical protein
MAVSKMRRLSGWTLIALTVVSVGVLALFYLGGVVDPKAEMKAPIYTAELLYWCYAIFGLSVVGLLFFGVLQFVSSLTTRPKDALVSFVVLVAFAALLGLTYSIGDGTPLPNINDDSAKYNVAGWLKISDMWIYSTYILLGLCVLAMAFGSVKKVFNR